MKNLSLSIFILLFIATSIQAQEDPIEISPLIGKELDRVERDYFHLFSRVDGFEKAVFYLNDDNSLRVEMTINSNGVIKDTVIPKYSSLEEIEKHIITRVFMDLRDDAGPNFIIQTDFSCLTAQKMITLEEQQLFTVDKLTVEQEFNEPSISSIWGTDLNDIHTVILEGESNIWSYARGGAAIGTLTGILAGLYIASQQKNEEGMASSKPFYFASSVLIGAALGLVVGAILGISLSEEEVIIDPHTPEGLSALKSYSLYDRKQKQNN